MVRCVLVVLGLLMCLAAGTCLAQQPLRFEAEDVTEPRGAWIADRHTESKWNLWSTDKDAEKKWSEGVVLQSPRVMADRALPEDGAPPLHSHVKDIPPGKYDVEIGGVGRPMAISLDGETWQRISSSSRNLGLLEIGPGGFELWVDDRYASETNPGSCYYDYLEFTPLPDPKRKPKVEGYADERVEEPMGRGLVALARADGSVYVGWRLLKDDPADVAFDVYRHTEPLGLQQLNDQPLTKTTDFVDARPVKGIRNDYRVVAVVGGKQTQQAEAVSATPVGEAGEPISVEVDGRQTVTLEVAPGDEVRGYVSIPLDGDHTFQKCGIADLNGDGAYDYVLKQPSANIDPYVKYWKRSPETYKIEAYLADGTFLWRYDLGWAIERGIWYSPMVVYDLDGDGRAEVCLKAGEGDPRDADGYVRSGPEYLLVLDGMTGREKARVDWPDRDDFPSYNYASRNQMCVAYLDGKTPSLIVVRGTYNVIQVRAYAFHDGALTEQWRWHDGEEGGRYRGQGAHSMHAVDVDDDGRDEIFLGSAVLDDHGVGLWSTRLGHPDHHYVGDIDPDRPGLEVYYGIESRRPNNACCLVDARTGELLWGIETSTRHVHAAGMCSDIDSAHPGLECYSSDTDSEKKSNVRWLFDARGNVLRDDLDWGFGLRTVYWDADLQRELLRGRNIMNYGDDEVIGQIAGSVVGYGDVLGDWREELIVSVPGELRIYSTTIPAVDRRVCLMQDPLYRLDVCIQAMGYTQCPMTTECLSAVGSRQ